ncbi:damage-inducible protein DinB [Rhizobium leguminosarum]|uniref:DinB family protein n=1 Tax=Rhizobium TaxID=379 RepID=UPI001389C3EA|nr:MULTISPECIES: DinB family protein [Rhizobium]MBY5356858.1 damage-inducible protein DinB [Rhizobium leguminosarum]NDK53930.1 damage-inducible protein DinB [Rhizobium laguerreae]NNH44756.1 damage-inducible protein DinB [Rhizobium laguerreae]NNH57630.1 damage-inducible protein DinB [Rhizobium laguerreae]UWM74629.1 DinB family protein [Rhizobium leguminosarum bv. viciae]
MPTFDPVRPFRKLAYNNALANRRLLRTCATLKPGEFEAPRTSFFPSIKETLNHIITVDWFYVDGLEGGTLGLKAFEVDEPFDDVFSLAEAQAKVDQRLVTLCEALTPERLTSTIGLHRGDRIQEERMDDVLGHLFQHQTHHRGQVHAMLSGTSVAPPQLDEFIVADDARFRGSELAALGWSEETLMR